MPAGGSVCRLVRCVNATLSEPVLFTAGTVRDVSGEGGRGYDVSGGGGELPSQHEPGTDAMHVVRDIIVATCVAACSGKD